MRKRGAGGFGVSRILLIAAIACFAIQALGISLDIDLDLIALGLALGFASFLF